MNGHGLFWSRAAKWSAPPITASTIPITTAAISTARAEVGE